MPSPFRDRPKSTWVAHNRLAFAIRDAYPVSLGHTLVIPHRLVPTWFDATAEEQQAIMALVDEVKRRLDEEHQPDGYNVGFNVGAAAGQTVMHLHVHVIPRYRGDMDDPRGGVRHAIPSKGNYAKEADAPLATGGEEDPFARHVLPLLARSSNAAIVAAFVQETGLHRIQTALDAALRQGASVRLITGDYLDITQAEALEMLLDWQSTWSEPDDIDVIDEVAPPASTGIFEARVIEVDSLPGRTRAFHPKSWHLEGEGFGVAFVGSSNLSRSALDTGIEWNLRVDRDRDSLACRRVKEAFDELWERARGLDSEWVAEYAKRAKQRPAALPPGEVDADTPLQPATPHSVQVEALEELRRAREDGRRRALVVLATGLGKTWLAAFDLAQLRDELGRPPRLLFVAHRREILRQAAATYRRLLHAQDEPARVGWFLEEHADLSADLVFASVAKLSRPAYLDRLAAERFDYVVIDEVHHAAADSYRRILSKIDPTFLLGLTATPDRADSADILGLFDDFVAYRADIGQGIEIGRLVPFRYFGVKDDVDYRPENIPWRNRRFDPAALAAAVQTEDRMRTLWSAWKAHPAERSLVFCCSIAHTDFVSEWLSERGVRVAKVYSAPETDDRDQALDDLAAGKLDAVCAIDVFNEGVDVPAIDRVVMLRPTESGLLFLQQLGRGLRAADGKDELLIIDFVGNHRLFLERLRTLLSLGGEASTSQLRALIGEGSVELPDGCSVEIELEAKEMLDRLFRLGGADEVERTYQELKLTRGERPTAGELLRVGCLPSLLRRRHGSWLGFVRAEGDLGQEQERAYDAASAFLDELEITEMTKSFKMVTLEALIEAGALDKGLPHRDLALRSWSLIRRSPELLEDVPAKERPPEEQDEGATRRWLSYWRRNPVEAWTSVRKGKRTWFRLEGEGRPAGEQRLALNLDIAPELLPAFHELVREMVDYRLSQYRRRPSAAAAPSEAFVCRVTWNKRDPILKLPDRARNEVPEGDRLVHMMDGASWSFRFAKQFCNVARPAGESRNQLPDLLRSWFGPRAGHPGTSFHVRFDARPDGLWVEPVETNVISLAARRAVRAYPDLRAAAGHALGEIEAPDTGTVTLPVEGDPEQLFAVRVSGDSMDGGRSPLRDGDWAVLRLCRGAPPSQVEGRVVLMQLPPEGPSSGGRYQIKRLVRHAGGWQLRSDNPSGPTFEADDGMVVIARLERAVRPEDLAPSPGTVMSEDELPRVFGIDDLEPRTGRWGGHLFVFTGDAGSSGESGGVVAYSGERMPGETAFVLVSSGSPVAWGSDGEPDEEGGEVGERFTYLGVGRWDEGSGGWRI